ncbi:hypothetical protein ITK26_23635 (plasmid) [Salmonella enterica]|nr:hypothetical protein ITK26_23635 [Salmonella enterica]
MGSCAAPSAKGDDKFITTDYLQQCPSGYATNPMVSPLIEHMKENLRQQILDRAEQQRQESGQDGN